MAQVLKTNKQTNKQSKTWVEKAMATHSSTLAWKIQWMEELCRLSPQGR